jgi:hypothetical protein
MLMETVFRGAGKCDFDSVALILEFKFAPDGPFLRRAAPQLCRDSIFSDGGMTEVDSGATFLIRPHYGFGDYVVDIAHDFNTTPPGVSVDGFAPGRAKSQKRLHRENPLGSIGECD